jgi:hypothetical protein
MEDQHCLLRRVFFVFTLNLSTMPKRGQSAQYWYLPVDILESSGTSIFLSRALAYSVDSKPNIPNIFDVLNKTEYIRNTKNRIYSEYSVSLPVYRRWAAATGDRYLRGYLAVLFREN